ncbi:MAG: carboxypeptidase regulatory-like domain-containing protein, partial [Planctomycetota bacterium]
MSVNLLRRPGLFLAVGLAAGAFALAHVRLINSSNGNALFWEQPSQVTIVIQKSGSDDIPDRGHVPALRNAIAEWNGATGTSARLLEVTNSADQNSQDWASSARHLIMFDESNSSGFFPSGSGIVAVTPISFFSGGNIVDADILFNGRSFRFTTEGTVGRFDVQDVATHELGHILGLDHTGAAGASLNPYVDPTQLLHRSISIDEVHGLRDAYPSGGHGTLGGQIVRSTNGARLPGAWVAARDADGRLAGAALCDANGRFTMRGMDPGTYTVYATPLDFPVSASNLTPGHSIQTNFESTVLGTAVVSGTGTTQMGTRQVGPDVVLSLGQNSDGFPLRAISGASRTLLLRGRGLWPGGSLVASDPTLTIENVVWGGLWVMF